MEDWARLLSQGSAAGLAGERAVEAASGRYSSDTDAIPW